MEVKKLFYVIIYLIQIYIAFSKAVLLSVFQINRHGARTPKHFEERQKKLFFGSQNMQLTINGYRQEQLLGSYMKEKYVESFNFINPEYKKEEFLIMSSPTQRTIFSAAGFLSGLFPNYVIKTKYININENLNLKNISRNNTTELKNSKKDKHFLRDQKLNDEYNSENNQNKDEIKANNNDEHLKMRKPNNKLRNLTSQNLRLFAPFSNETDKPTSLINIGQSFLNNLSPKKFFLDILNLKNEDSVPQLHDFNELEKKSISFLSLERKEIPLFIDNPLYDRLFHAWKCIYKGKQLVENLKNLNPIFDITEEEILVALSDFEKILRFNENDFSEKKYKNKKDKLLALVKFYMSYIYHFKLNTNEKLNKETCKTFKKFIINDWYSVINAENQEEIKIPISEFFDTLLNHFKKGIENHKITLNEKENEGNSTLKNNKNIKDNYIKYKVYSGHDTIIVNMLRGILDHLYIKDNLKRSLEDDNIFKFFVPEFGSYITFELYFDEIGKYYFVKIIYNGMTIYDGIKILNVSQEQDKYLNEIRFERFEDLMNFNINKDYEILDCNTEGELK